MKSYHSKISVIFALALGLCCASVSLRAAEPQQWVADIPIIDGLTVAAELSFSFDSPSGRVMVIYARPDKQDTDITAAYSRLLGALGWQADTQGFSRASEQLKIEKVRVENIDLWRFALTPRPAS